MIAGFSERDMIVVLAVLLLVVLLLARWRLRRPVIEDMSEIEDVVGGHRDGEYLEQAKKDGIHRDTALAYEAELKTFGREIRRRDRERRRREIDDTIGGFDLD